jgi:type II secretory pathway pseudopilin PulG
MSRPNLRGERGFTLIELLVSALAGIVVAAATGAIVIVSIHFSSNFGDRVDANQQARVAMEKITQALNSSCVSVAVPPILATGAAPGSVSDANNAIFYSRLSALPTINPNQLIVSYAGGSLTMYTYGPAIGSAPNWTFPTTPATSFVLLPHAAPQTIAGVAQPVFQYYGYTPGGSTMSATPYATPLSVANASTTAMITISFQALPTSGNAATNRGATITTSVVLRLTPASGATSNTPCG